MIRRGLVLTRRSFFRLALALTAAAAAGGVQAQDTPRRPFFDDGTDFTK